MHSSVSVARFGFAAIMAPQVMAGKRVQQNLYRSHKDKIIGGVCGGLGGYFDVDPVIFRILFVVLTFVNGIGLLLYAILWIVVPLKEEPFFDDGGSSTHTHERAVGSSKREYSSISQTAHKIPQKKSVWRIIVAIIVILVGLAALFSYFFSTNLLRFEIMWPFFLILIGLYLIFKE